MSPPRDYRDYPPPPVRRGDIDDYRMRGPPPPPPRYESRSGYYGSEDPVAYSRGYPPPASRDYDRYDRRPPPTTERYGGYPPPPPAVRPRTPPGGGPPSRREEFERPPTRSVIFSRGRRLSHCPYSETMPPQLNTAAQLPHHQHATVTIPLALAPTHARGL